MRKAPSRKLALPGVVFAQKRSPLLLILPLAIVLLTLQARSAVIEVPADYSTIQAAIDASADGDEIIVSPGTYVENIKFNGKNIILRSTDPMRTIIDGKDADSVVTFSGTEAATCTLSGFTITNGYADQGGGIRGNNTLAVIENNVIKSNKAYGTWPKGIGAGLAFCNGTIKNNTITDNFADTGGGGLDSCGGHIRNNIISANSALKYGAGISSCHGLIENNVISNNTVYNGSGGGIQFCHGTIRNNIIMNNNADWRGGGINNCHGTIEGNTVTNNSAKWGGGLNYCDGIIQSNNIRKNWAMWEGGGLKQCDGTIRNNIITGNSAGRDGGAIEACFVATIQNNTIWGNSAGDTGGGLAFCRYGTTIINCIIVQNDAPSGSQIYDSNVPSYSCIQNWTGGGTGNISFDPRLVDPAKGDYHLLSTSPCIDSGSYVTDLNQDFEGDTRPYNSTSEPRGDGSDFDIGADEFIGLRGFDFTISPEGWTTGSAAMFAPPQWSWESGILKMIAHANTGIFGFWVSPSDALAADAAYLYCARYVVTTDVADQSLVPQIRLRVNSSNFQQVDYMIIESAGDGGASPATTGTTYYFHFVPPANDDFCMLAFDLLNINPEDAAQAELALDNVLVERFAINALSIPTVEYSYDFATSGHGWTTGGAPPTYALPNFFHSNDALILQATTNTNIFGFWRSNEADIIVETAKLYRGTFEVGTDISDKSRVPQLRLRFNTENLQASRTLGIESIGDGANSPATTNTTYDRLYFLPPANCVGNGLIVSFDLLNLDPSDAPNGALILDSAKIETLSPPALP